MPKKIPQNPDPRGVRVRPRRSLLFPRKKVSQFLIKNLLIKTNKKLLKKISNKNPNKILNKKWKKNLLKSQRRNLNQNKSIKIAPKLTQRNKSLRNPIKENRPPWASPRLHRRLLRSKTSRLSTFTRLSKPRKRKSSFYKTCSIWIKKPIKKFQREKINKLITIDFLNKICLEITQANISRYVEGGATCWTRSNNIVNQPGTGDL